MKYTEANTPKVAAALFEIFLKHTNKHESLIVALHGNLGAGKTTLTQNIAHILNIEEQIQSPTFVIQKNYSPQNQPFESLIHIDAYRIEEETDMEQLSIQETLLQKKSLIIIEWPEQISGYIPADAVEVFLDYADQDSRSIRVEIGDQEVEMKI